MDLPNDGLPNDVKNNQYYNITEEDLRKGKITVHVLNDGRHLYALRYGKQKDNIAIIALATIDGKKDNKQIRDTLLNRMNRLKISPKLRDIENVEALEERYHTEGFEMTPEGKEIFSQGSKEYVLNSVVQTVKFDDEQGKLEQLYYDTIEADNKRNSERLKQYLKALSKLHPKEYEKYKKGQESIFKVMTINSLDVPKTYEQAKYVENTLNAMDGFDKKSIIEDMKVNEESNKNNLYKRFLEVKLLALLREKVRELSGMKAEDKLSEIQKLKERILYNHGINEYLFSNGDRPIRPKEIEYLAFLEDVDVKDEDLYKKEIEILLQAVDPMKTQLYEENEMEIKSYCEKMKEFGVVYEIEPQEPEKDSQSIRPQGGQEPGD